MRKFAGVTTPCQSNAAATRLVRSPPAAKNVATTRISDQRAQRDTDRAPTSRGTGVPALQRARRAQRALDMRAPQRGGERVAGFRRHLVGDRGGRPVRQAAVAVEPAQAVGRASAARTRNSGTAAATARTKNSEQADGAAERRQRRATARARRARGTGRRRSRSTPAPATAAPRRSTSARAASARDSRLRPCSERGSLRSSGRSAVTRLGPVGSGRRRIVRQSSTL